MRRAIEVPLEGELSSWQGAFDFPELLTSVCSLRETGLLRFVAAEAEKTLFLRQGEIIFAQSSSEDDRLGEYLLRAGKIGLRDLRSVGTAVRPGKRLGAVLVEQGLLDARELVHVVVDHVRAIIFGLFRWTEAGYRFSIGPLPSRETITLDVGTPRLLVAAIRQIDSWRRVQRGIGGAEACYRAVVGRESLIRDLDLEVAAIELLAALRRPMTVLEACASSDLEDFEVCRLLWAYRILELVEVAETAPVEGWTSAAGNGAAKNQPLEAGRDPRGDPVAASSQVDPGAGPSPPSTLGAEDSDLEGLSLALGEQEPE